MWRIVQDSSTGRQVLLFVVRKAVRIGRPVESICDEQPQLQPALLRLSAMISQCFTPSSARLLLVQNRLRCGFAQFKSGRRGDTDSSRGELPEASSIEKWFSRSPLTVRNSQSQC